MLAHSQLLRSSITLVEQNIPTQLKYQIMPVPVVVQEIIEISPQPTVQQVIETILKAFYI